MRTLVVLAVLVSIPTAALGDAPGRCTRAKLRATTAYVRAYLDCHAGAAAAGAEPAFACLVAAGDAIRARVADADALGACPGTPEQIANRICAPFLGAGDPACRAAKYRAVGWGLARRLACHGDAIRRRKPPRPGCFARVETRVARRIARADALGACGGDAAHLGALVDRCALDFATALSCGNDRLDYGELCEGTSAFCAGCTIVRGECCATAPGCFQFSGPIEECFFAGGLDVLPGFCTGTGCVDDIPLSTTPVCCQDAGAACTDGVATTAAELAGLAACGPGSFPVLGTCGADGRCIPATDAPVALPTTTTLATTTTTTSVPGSTTTTLPFPVCIDIGAPCGSCGTGTCVQPLAGIPIGACVAADAVGPCAATEPACGAGEICLTARAACHALCYAE